MIYRQESDALNLDKFCFELDLNVQSHVEMLEIAKYFKLPDIMGVAIANFNPQDPNLAEFLLCSVPNRLQQCFIGKFGIWHAKDLILGLTNLCSKVQEEIIIK